MRVAAETPLPWGHCSDHTGRARGEQGVWEKHSNAAAVVNAATELLARPSDTA